MLKRFPEPVVMETHGGTGRLFDRVYADVTRGVVFEKDAAKAEILARQRPTWSVYQAEAEEALLAGAARHLPVNVLDVDPYGSPWPFLIAFFDSDRPMADRIGIVVNDGLRMRVKLGVAWHDALLADVVQRFGSSLYEKYLEACEFKLQAIAAQYGYRVSEWTGYYTGDSGDMTHYAAVLERAAKH